MKEIKTLEDRKKELVEKGKKQGYITYEQLAEALKGLDIDSDALDELYNFLVENEIDVTTGTDDEEDDGIVTDPNELKVEELTFSKDVKINSTGSSIVTMLFPK